MAIWKKKLLTIVTVGQDHVTLTQGSGTRLEYCASSAMDWDNEQSASESLKKIFPLAQRQQAGEVCLVLPRLLFFTKLIHLPSLDEQEMRKMAALQISQHLPYAEEQAVWDIVVCGRRGSASDVLLIAVQRETVMKYLRLVASVGLAPTVVTMSSSALAGLLRTLDPVSHTVLFFSDQTSTEICFCQEGKFYFSRGIIYGTKDLSGQHLADFFTQVRLTFEAQRKNFAQLGAPAGSYISPFASGLPEGFWEQCTKESGIAWKEITLDDLKKKTAGFSFPKQENIPMDALPGVTILRQGLKNICNFLPKDFKERQNFQVGKRNTIVVVILILLSVLSMTLAVGAPILKKAQRLKALDEELNMVQDPFSKVRKEKELWAAIHQRLNGQIPPLTVIDELYRVAPVGISFSRIRVSEQNELDLEGIAVQSSLVNDLQEKMIAASLFRDVRLEHRVGKTSPMGEVSQFEMTAKLQSISQGKNE